MDEGIGRGARDRVPDSMESGSRHIPYLETEFGSGRKDAHLIGRLDILMLVVAGALRFLFNIFYDCPRSRFGAGILAEVGGPDAEEDKEKRCREYGRQH